MHLHPEGGMLLLQKPIGWTSFQLVKKTKIILQPFYSRHQTRTVKLRVGHAGTLDPLAEGLMIVCYGHQTRNISEFSELDKKYEGIITLGKTTPSFDLELPFDNEYPIEHIREEMIVRAASQLEGKQFQIPPLFSAIKIGGKRAYELARSGIPKTLSQRPIEVFSFEILKINIPDVHFRIHCSKGTYIRAIARDFGQLLQSGAYLKHLCRTAIGSYSLSQALSLDMLENQIRGNPLSIE